MFEQTIIHHHRRPWTLAVSLSLQSALAGAVVLVSIITIDRLPNIALPVPLPPLPRAPQAVEVVMTEITRNAQVRASAVFTAPLRIPERVAMIVEDVAAVNASEAPAGLAGTGMPGGVYYGAGQIYTADHFAAPPPPPAQVKPAEPARVPEPPKVVKLGGNVLEARMLNRVIPIYPPLARSMRISGTVKLQGIIAADGTVRELQVLSGHPLLVKAALDAVRQWTYRPTLLNGEPVEVNAPIDVHFRLTQ
jgi:protein TonB